MISLSQALSTIEVALDEKNYDLAIETAVEQLKGSKNSKLNILL